MTGKAQKNSIDFDMFTLEELTEWSGLLLDIQKHAEPGHSRMHLDAVIKEKKFLIRLIQKYKLRDGHTNLNNFLVDTLLRVGLALARKRRDEKICAVLGSLTTTYDT